MYGIFFHVLAIGIVEGILLGILISNIVGIEFGIIIGNMVGIII